MSEVKILLVDDHDLVRDMLQQRLEDERGLTVVGSASNGEDAVSMARATKPDMVIMDIDMPGIICFDAAESIRTMLPDVRLIFLSAFAHDRYIDQALKVGARGYVTKGESPNTLIDAIRQVAKDGAYFSPDISSRIVIDAEGTALSSRAERSVANTLTARETEVLCYLARGLTKKAIAETMALSVKTVETHTQNVMRKLDLHDRVELARYAFREGLAEP